MRKWKIIDSTILTFFRFNVASHSSGEPSGCSSEEIPYVCPKPFNEVSFQSGDDHPVFDDSMYRILPQHPDLPPPHHFFKMIPDRTMFQRRIECEGFAPYFQVTFKILKYNSFKTTCICLNYISRLIRFEYLTVLKLVRNNLYLGIITNRNFFFYCKKCPVFFLKC